MIKSLITILITCIQFINVNAQTIYIDSQNGDDDNPGTMEAPLFSIYKAVALIKSSDNAIHIIKINPGTYILDRAVTITTDKSLENKRISIQATILPGDAAWTPDKMPVIICNGKKGDITIHNNFVISFLIEESHVTISGLKFHGYFYPHVRYFPIARFNKVKTDLLVEQCIFIGDANISQIQAGVIAHGNEVKIDHCIFYKIRNTVVFFQDSGNGIKYGNGITNSIIYGASQAVWTVSPDSDFKFENNIVSNCRYVFVKYDYNPSKYTLDNCVIVNNQYYTGIPDKEKGQLRPGKFELYEHDIIKEGKISLRLTGVDDKPFLDEVDKPLPLDYLHLVPGSAGVDLNAGLFKNPRH